MKKQHYIIWFINNIILVQRKKDIICIAINLQTMKLLHHYILR